VSCRELRIRKSKKTSRRNAKDVRDADEVSRWKGLDRDSYASRPEVVSHPPKICSDRMKRIYERVAYIE
jgi:hypothetical protein